MFDMIEITFENKEPLRITNDSESQLGQVSTLRHIPGSTLKGFVINSFAKEPAFEELLPTLVSDRVKFLNAYLTVQNHVLLPSPKGFYEDKKQEEEGKTTKKIENVVINGEISDGNKRAGIGRYCYMQDGILHYYNMETSSDLKIKVNLEQPNEKRNVFRNDYIKSGYRFTGYIVVEDCALADKIMKLFAGDIYLGNARSSGFGRCEVISCRKIKELPYQEYAVDKDQEGSCYMMLLSHTAMRGEYGENEGLNLKALETKMGVSDLEIKFCSTSTVNVSTFNRTWKTRGASIHAYEMGSVFHLTYTGTFRAECAAELMAEGIGMNRNEGFGRILFLKDYEAIAEKQKETCAFAGKSKKEALPEAEDAVVLKQIARNYLNKILEKAMVCYVVNTPLKSGGINNSQVGVVEGLISANKYQPKEAVSVLEKYFQHAIEKEDRTKVQKQRVSIRGFEKTVVDILGKPLMETLNNELEEKHQNIFKNGIWDYKIREIFSEEDELKLKQELILMLIRYDNKKGDK